MANTDLTSFSGPELCRLEAHQAVDLLKKGEISSKNLLQASLSRISEVSAAINATPTLCEERAYAACNALDGNNGNDSGWLAGLPISIKDLTQVRGVRTTFGTGPTGENGKNSTFSGGGVTEAVGTVPVLPC